MVELTEKLLKIANGEFQPGDLPFKLKCAIVLVGAGAGVLAACATPGGLIALPAAVLAGSSIAGAVATGLTALRGWGCSPPSPGQQPA